MMTFNYRYHTDGQGRFHLWFNGETYVFGRGAGLDPRRLDVHHISLVPAYWTLIGKEVPEAPEQSLKEVIDEAIAFVFDSKHLHD